MKGCLALLAIFGGLMWWEAGRIEAKGLPYPWAAAGVLALLATLAAGSVWGWVEARGRQHEPETPPDQWKDGELVRLSGFVRTRGAALRTPVTGLHAVIYHYELRPRVRSRQTDRRIREGAEGIGMADCAIETRWGLIPLSGFPRLAGFPERQYGERHHWQAMARTLAGTAWRIRGGLSGAEDVGELVEAVTRAEGREPLHLVNRRTLDLMRLKTSEDPDAEPDEAALFPVLEKGRWISAERVVEAGAEVTVTGTYRTAPRRLDIGLALDLSRAKHSIQPGGAAETAGREARRALGFALALALLAGAGHSAVFAGEGEHYRAVVETLSGMRER